MKQKAIDYLVANMPSIYTNYYRYGSNDWLEDVLGYNPFEYFMDVPDFYLAPLEQAAGAMELENCKIIFENLSVLSESQAADERLWAGLCHSTFYSYVRRRHNYHKKDFADVKNDCRNIISRFFFSGGARAGAYRNTLAKCWWIGLLTYRKNERNKWKLLDCLGPEDFSTKVSDIFFSNTFSGNEAIVEGICKGIYYFKDAGISINVKDHIRPTMQYMNAIGGAALLDYYSADEIRNLFIENVGKIRNGKQNDFSGYEDVLDDQITEEEADEATAAEISIDYNSLQDITEVVTEPLKEDVFGALEEVVYGCMVTLLNEKDGKRMVLNVGKEGEKLPPLQKMIIGSKVGDTVKQFTKTFSIQKIEWGDN